ncbi:MAG: TRAP transporter small permease [Desulfotomaculales bacterium]
MNFEKLFKRLNEGLAWLAGVALILMMLLSVANIVLRLAHRPLGGTAEIVGWLAALTAAFALGYTQQRRGHVAIDLFVERLPKRPQAFIGAAVAFAAGIIFALAAWQVGVLAYRLSRLGKLSETTHVSYAPFVYAVALGLVCLTLVLIADLLKLGKGDFFK